MIDFGGRSPNSIKLKGIFYTEPTNILDNYNSKRKKENAEKGFETCNRLASNY